MVISGIGKLHRSYFVQESVWAKNWAEFSATCVISGKGKQLASIYEHNLVWVKQPSYVTWSVDCVLERVCCVSAVVVVHVLPVLCPTYNPNVCVPLLDMFGLLCFCSSPQ